MKKILINPFYIYILSFTFVLTLYQLNWSRLYPELSFDLYVFVTISMFVSLLLGIAYHIFFLEGCYNDKHKFLYIKSDPIRNIINGTIFVYALYALEFLYARDIPIVSMILGTSQPGDYLDFGIPTFHVAIVSLSHLMLSMHLDRMYKENNKRHLILVVSVLICDALTLSRGLFVFSIMIWGFIKLFYIKKINFKYIVYFLFFMVVFSYFFGLVGQYRSANGDHNYEEQILGASEDFKSSGVPTSFLWVYTYTTSPLANLQQAINQNHKTGSDFSTFVIRCLTHDSISKRIINFEGEKFPLIAPNLTVGTIYYFSYNYFGYLGLVVTYIYMAMLVFVLSLFSKGTMYFVPISSMLSSLIFLSIFDNMFISGFSLALFLSFLFVISKRFIVFTQKKL